MKKQLSFLLALCMILSLSNMVAFADDEFILPEYNTADYPVEFKTTLDAIDDLKVPCSEQGTIVELAYTTPAYAVNEMLGKDVTMDKTLQVYLPYGYDEANQYNILYLLHGTGGKDTYWFFDAEPETTRNVLDNMIQQGLCEPLIVVTPCYITEIKGKEFKISNDLVAAYAVEHNDSYLLVRNDLWTEFFGYELRKDIIPLVEAQFSTYAGKDVSEGSLIASREHRALAGLSRGSMAAMRAGMLTNLDIFANFGNFSGIWLDFEKLEEVLLSTDYSVKFWYNGTGTNDSVGSAAINQLDFHNEVQEKLTDMIHDGENYCMIVKDGGAHDFPSWTIDLYNSLLVFFK